MWTEIERAVAEGRRELVLSGPETAERLRKEGALPVELWALRDLTHLRISHTGAEILPPEIGRLVNLRELLIFGNQFESLPDEVFRLKELRHLDAADNKLKSLPDELASLSNLTHLNVRGNNLKTLPRLAALKELSIVDASGNQLESFPDLCYSDNARLADLLLSRNQISDIPGTIAILPVLKTLDLSNNSLKRIPIEVAKIPKLKEVNFKDNKLSDNRLRKLVDQCQTKQVLTYVLKNCTKADAVKPKPDIEDFTKLTVEEPSEPAELHDEIRVIPHDDSVPRVISDRDRVKPIRAHIVCCIVRGLNCTDESVKSFLRLQTKLHDTICEKRNAATIATHDLAKLKPGDLSYTVVPPNELRIRPLNETKIRSGLELCSRLRKEAEELRKEKKRASYSGIHKYLYLLDGKNLYPCLKDSEGDVLSFPPITNADSTKISAETKDILIEVTSPQTQTVCRKVMDALLLEMLICGLGGTVDGTVPLNRLGNRHRLNVQQVKIYDIEGKMQVIYPSKVDLFYESKSNLKIVRD